MNNKKSGKGIYRFANGEMYEGNFENNLYNGEGKYIWGLDRRKYEGEFKNGIISGKGVFTYNDGAIYILKTEKKMGKGSLNSRTVKNIMEIG